MSKFFVELQKILYTFSIKFIEKTLEAGSFLLLLCMEITSRENRIFKDLLKLTQKKYRRETGLCIVEGEKLVREHIGSAVQIFVRSASMS